jgi:hypothetical protein
MGAKYDFAKKKIRKKWKRCGVIMGWIIFVLGLIALVMGAYSRMGYAVCLLIAVSWFISLHRGSLKRKRERELMKKLEKIEGGP